MNTGTSVSESPQDSLEQLVERYNSMGRLQDRVDISALAGPISPSDDKFLAQLIRPLKYYYRNPLVGGILASLSTQFILDNVPNIPLGIIEKGADISLGAGLASAIGLGLAKQYIYNERDLLKPKKGAGLKDKARCAVLNNPLVSAAIPASALPALFTLYSYASPVSGNSDPNSTVIPLALAGYLGGYALIEMARSNEFIRKGFAERKKRQVQGDSLADKLKTAYNWPFEHPGIVGGIAGAAALAYAIGGALNFPAAGPLHPRPEYIPQAVAGIALLGALASSAAYVGTSAASWVLHSDSLGLMRDSIKQSLYSALGRTDQAISCQKRLMEVPTTESNEAKNHFRLGDLYLKADRFDEAMLEYFAAINLTGKKGRVYLNPVDALSGLVGMVNPFPAINALAGDPGHRFGENLENLLDKYEKARDAGDESTVKFEPVYERINKWFSRDSKARLMRAMRQIRYRVLDAADHNFRRILVDEPEKPEYHLLYAKFLELVGDMTTSRREYGQTISSLIAQAASTGAFHRLGHSRNEVLIYKPNILVGKTLIFKRSPHKAEIVAENSALTLFHQELDSAVAKPIKMMSDSDWHYLIVEHSGDKTLQDLADEGALTFENLLDTINLCAEIQAYGNRISEALKLEPVIDAPQYIDSDGRRRSNIMSGRSIYFLNRFQDIFLDFIESEYGYHTKSRQDLLDLYAPINGILSGLPVSFSKDSFRKNWVLGGDAKVVSIDFGTLRWLPIQIDLSNIIEGSPSSLTDRQTGDLLGAYLDIYSQLNKERIRRDEFMSGYYPCALHRHLELVGYGGKGYLGTQYGGNTASAPEIIWHIRKARHNLEIASESYPSLADVRQDLDTFLGNLENKLAEST